jgi:hypothetical protein
MRALLLIAVLGCGSSRAESPTQAAAPPPAADQAIEPVRVIAAAELDVTKGVVRQTGAGLRIDDPTVRAVAQGAHGDEAELSFVYAGPTARTAALASGAQRRQVGLKLRAADGCNLVYVMWRLDEGVVVSIKRNPGDRTHADCGAGGYRTVRAQRQVRVAAPTVGTSYRLQASIVDGELIARLDDREVWRGRLGSMSRGLHGPPGLRTDNVALDQVEFRASLAPRQKLAAHAE